MNEYVRNHTARLTIVAWQTRGIARSAGTYYNRRFHLLSNLHRVFFSYPASNWNLRLEQEVAQRNRPSNSPSPSISIYIGDSGVISMPAGYCRHLVGKILINIFHCDIVEMRRVGKLVTISTFS